MDHGKLLLIDQSDQIALGSHGAIQASTRPLQKAHNRNLFLRRRHWDKHSAEIRVTEARSSFPHGRTTCQNEALLRRETKKSGEVGWHRVRKTRRKDDVLWRALAVTIGYANRARKCVHSMDHKLPAPHALVASLVQGDHKSPRSSVLSQRHLTVSKTRHNVVTVSNGKMGFSEHCLTPLSGPVPGNAADPQQARVFVLGIWQ